MNNQPDEEGNFILDPELNFLSPELRAFLTYWEQKRQGREFPSRADIKPREILDLLPWLHMHDVEGPEKFRIRLVGTKLEALLPVRKYPGNPISILPPQIYRRLQTALEWVVHARAPLRTQGIPSPIPGQEFGGMENIIAPLSSNGADIDIIVTVSLLMEK